MPALNKQAEMRMQRQHVTEYYGTTYFLVGYENPIAKFGDLHFEMSSLLRISERKNMPVLNKGVETRLQRQMETENYKNLSVHWYTLECTP